MSVYGLTQFEVEELIELSNGYCTLYVLVAVLSLAFVNYALLGLGDVGGDTWRQWPHLTSPVG